jgi:hypothetical protein
MKLFEKRKKRSRKKDSSFWGTKKPNPYRTTYNVYTYNDKGMGRKVKTFNSTQEAHSWVSNQKAILPYADYKVVKDVKKRGFV